MISQQYSEVFGILEFKQRICQGFQLLQRQGLDAGGGGVGQGASAAVELAEGHLCFTAGFAARLSFFQEHLGGAVVAQLIWGRTKP
jgi:hypothetical protein